jgi:NADH dehydrogenase (ubiquinone) 1 alpha/beta subcomplex 1
MLKNIALVYKTLFAPSKKFFSNKLFALKCARINSNIFNLKYFSTNNHISEKESLELIEAGVFEVLKSAAKCKHDKLSRSANFDELGFDSLDQVELVVAMEEKFNINISDDDSLKIQTVLDAIQIMHSYYLKEKVNVGSVVERKDSTDIAK